jgi:REP element-mobilizing transposase RayT
MRTPYTQLYVHLTWSTWDRLSLISKIIQSRLYASIANKCRQLKCEPLAIGGMEDHVHLLIRLHTSVALATLIKEVKGTSSHLVTHEITPEELFKWQGGYGAFTIRKKDVLRVKAYIENQELNHADGSLQAHWEPRLTIERLPGD